MQVEEFLITKVGEGEVVMQAEEVEGVWRMILGVASARNQEEHRNGIIINKMVGKLTAQICPTKII